MDNNKDFATVVILFVGSNEYSMCTWWNLRGNRNQKFLLLILLIITLQLSKFTTTNANKNWVNIYKPFSKDHFSNFFDRMGLCQVFKKHIINEFIFKNTSQLTMNFTMLLQEIDTMPFSFDAISTTEVLSGLPSLLFLCM